MSSTASRANHPSADNTGSHAASEPSSEAVTLSELIADTGPLPVDAALECLQRVAERLESNSCESVHSLDPSQILIDDNGEIWLRPATPASSVDSSPRTNPNGEDFHGLGRLLLYLTTANSHHLRDDFDLDSANLPPSVTTLASRLASREGICYSSYAALASDAANLRDGTEPKPPSSSSDQPPPPSRIAPETLADDHSEPETSTAADLPIPNEAPKGSEPPQNLAGPTTAETTTPPAGIQPDATDQNQHEPTPSHATTWIALGLVAILIIALLLWWTTF